MGSGASTTKGEKHNRFLGISRPSFGREKRNRVAIMAVKVQERTKTRVVSTRHAYGGVAVKYSDTSGNRGLGSFWAPDYVLHFLQ